MQLEAVTPAAVYERNFRVALAGVDDVSQLAWGTLTDNLRAAKPKERLTRVEWAERHRTVATGARSGPFRWRVVPALRGVMEACDDPSVYEVVVQKPSQVGYTVSVLLNLLGYHIHQDPCSILVLFPKDGAGKRFEREKLRVTIKDTPVLAERIDVDTRNSDNTAEFKRFRGGFLQLAGANSPSNVKSTDARVGCVEEPDDVTHDVKEQGNPVDHIKARTKTFWNRLILIGGSPTIDGFSIVGAEMQLSDKRQGHVACPHCGHRQTLRWENVEWLDDADVQHPVYGTHRPDTARYRCDDDDCGALWTDREKNAALVDIEWIPTAAFNGVAGFDFSTGGELYSAIPESRMAVLARRYIEAKAEQRRGDDTKMREFVNGTLGRLWRVKADTPEIDDLIERVDDYPEWTTPAGGLVLVAGVDVQRGGENRGEARLEYVFRAYGRGLESWKVADGEILGNPLEPHVWTELERLMARPIRNLAGGELTLAAMSIDSSDGMTSDAVYAFCRKHKANGVIPVKGWNEQGNRQKEIFSRPQPLDHTSTGKAAKYGLRNYMVGTSKAKDQIHGRLKLPGDGPGRMHFDASTGREYFDQLTSEARIPGKRGRLVWTKKAGVPNEKLDCEVYALHAAHKLRLHRLTDSDWDSVEQRVRQPDLLAPRAAQRDSTRQANHDNQANPAREPRRAPAAHDDTGFGSDEWAL